MDLTEFKKFFLFNLIGSLIISASVAVVTVLIGIFNEVTWRVITTLGMVALHSLISLAFIWGDEKEGTFNELEFFSNTLFLLIVLSFITSLFGIWEILDEGLIWDIYITYFLLGFVALHGNILYKAMHKENYLDLIVYLNYVFMALVVILLLPIIYIDNSFTILGEFYYRILAAAGIIDGTLSILAIIFYKLYMHKHPRVEDPLEYGYIQGERRKKKKGLSWWVWILIIYLIIQVSLPFFLWGIRGSIF